MNQQKEKMMLRTKFEEELDKLHNQFYSMGTEVLSQINKTVRAFVSHDRELAKEVIEEDDTINEFETKLEKSLLKLSPCSSLFQTICEQLLLF